MSVLVFRKNMAVPGFEPGSSGSQPLMLTTTLYHRKDGTSGRHGNIDDAHNLVVLGSPSHTQASPPAHPDTLGGWCCKPTCAGQ